MTVFAVAPYLLLPGLAGRGGLSPGVQIFGCCVPGQEPFQVGAGGWLAAVAAAGVEVGQDVEPGDFGGSGDGPDGGGEPAASSLREP